LDRNDRFWMTHKGSPFPTVAEAIQEELESYRNSEEEIKRLKTSMGIEGESDIAFSLVNDTTARLTNAVNSLPQLMEKKRLIDMHTKIATAILNFIKARRLDSYFEIEEKVMSKQTLDRPLLDLLRDGEFGQAEDKLRLYIIYFICAQQLPESEQERLKEALQAAGCDLTALAYVQRWKGIMNRSPSISQATQYEGGGTKTVSMFTKLVSQARSKIENLAAAALHAGCVANIHRVYDQYVNFISLEDDFFVLKHQQSDQLSYYAINRANTRDEEMEALMDSIVDSLFALFVTLGNVPIIRCPRNSAAEMVARKLEKKLRENLWDARANLFHMDATQAGGGVFSFQRPVLLLLDRNMDLATPLHHTWSYQALVHDVLDLGLNLVYVEDETASAGKLIESIAA